MTGSTTGEQAPFRWRRGTEPASFCVPGASRRGPQAERTGFRSDSAGPEYATWRESEKSRHSCGPGPGTRRALGAGRSRHRGRVAPSERPVQVCRECNLYQVGTRVHPDTPSPEAIKSVSRWRSGRKICWRRRTPRQAAEKGRPDVKWQMPDVKTLGFAIFHLTSAMQDAFFSRPAGWLVRRTSRRGKPDPSVVQTARREEH